MVSISNYYITTSETVNQLLQNINIYAVRI